MRPAPLPQVPARAALGPPGGLARALAEGEPAPLVAFAASLAAGVGLLLVFAGAGGDSLPASLTGGVLCVSGVLVLFSCGWLDWVPFLILSLPLPAPYRTAELNLAMAAAVTALVLLAWLAAWGPRGGPVRVGRFPWRWAAALGGAVALSSLFALDRLAAVRESLNWVLMFSLLVVLTDHLSLDTKSRSRRLALWIATVMGLTGAAALLQTVGILPGTFPLGGTSLVRANLGFGWPNELGTFLAIGLPFAVYAVRVSRGRGARVLATLGLGATLLGLLCTFSRGSWLAALASLPALLLLGQRGTLAWTWLVMVFVVGLADLGTGGVLSARVTDTFQDPYVIQRMGLMLAGVLMFLANPLVGVGPGGYVTALDTYGPQVAWLWDYVGTSHNAYIEVAAELGTLGLLAFAGFLVASFRRLLAAARAPEEDPDAVLLRRAVLWAFTTTVLVGFTIWPLAHGLGQLVMAVLALGFTSAFTPGPSRAQETVARTAERAR